MTDNFWSQSFILSSLLPLPRLQDKGLQLLLTVPSVLPNQRGVNLWWQNEKYVWDVEIRLLKSNLQQHIFHFIQIFKVESFAPLLCLRGKHQHCKCPNLREVMTAVSGCAWQCCVTLSLCWIKAIWRVVISAFVFFLYDAELKSSQVIVTLLKESHQQDAADAEVKKD